jgi:hypothetical protein
MVLHLADELDLPLRERNQLLLAAGYAPVYAASALDAPQMSAVRAALRQLSIESFFPADPGTASVLHANWPTA